MLAAIAEASTAWVHFLLRERSCSARKQRLPSCSRACGVLVHICATAVARTAGRALCSTLGLPGNSSSPVGYTAAFDKFIGQDKASSPAGDVKMLRC